MPRRLLALLLVPILVLAACGGSSSKTSAASSTTVAAPATADKITLGYSAWPGWFPLAVADQQGIFKAAGLDVTLKYFADYIASIEAFASGKLDGNAQTLNDTMASVAGGSDQVIVIVGDNSTGNDKIICDKSITSIKDLKGKTIAAEAGVVDHFLLVQGLQKAGLTEKDIDFRGVATDAAASSFASGQFDCVGVFAPFWLTALKRPGSHELFTSKDFPGTIPDHIVVSRKLVDEHPKTVQKLVDAWYKTLAWIKANPDAATTIMAKAAETSVADYQQLAEGTTLFSAKQASDAFKDGSDTTSLVYTAKLINPFLVKSGFTQKEASLQGLFDASFTNDWLKRNGG
ncbi:MAG: NitT/TauT family transport system substrate-binding protein [Actinomycetota bacterium]|jgi:NitT/TauT family transport system substrate-binding protein|nr:NitT/TauT family transport system substrate-binding protein [Actinomycetota bacterium]